MSAQQRPQGNPKFSRDDLAFIEESKNVVKMVNPAIRDDDFVDAAVDEELQLRPHSLGQVLLRQNTAADVH